MIETFFAGMQTGCLFSLGVLFFIGVAIWISATSNDDLTDEELARLERMQQDN